MTALVGMFRLDPDEGAALLAALALGKDLLRAQKRSAERSGADPEPIRAKVSNADALGVMVETMLAADNHTDISRHERLTAPAVHLSSTTREVPAGPVGSREWREIDRWTARWEEPAFVMSGPSRLNK